MTPSRSSSVRSRETVALQPASRVPFFMVGNHTDYFAESQGLSRKKVEKSFEADATRSAPAPVEPTQNRRLAISTNQGFGISASEGLPPLRGVLWYTLHLFGRRIKRMRPDGIGRGIA